MHVTAEVASKSTQLDRVDSFLAVKTGKSRSYISQLIKGGYVLLRGVPPRKSDVVANGDTFELTFPPEPDIDLTPREIPFDIIYDSPRYAVINKPAGVVVQPAPGHLNDSLVNGLLYAFNITDDMGDKKGGFRPGIVHRLDKDTSGLMLVAKDRDSREILSKLFHDRLINKYYVAIAMGKPRFQEMLINEPIARDKIHRQRMCIDTGGRTAKTGVKVSKLFVNSFMADIRLYTGRTHQIRIHFKHIGHPLLGDSLYGGASAARLFHRQALHSYKIEFVDPFAGKPVSYTAPLPEDMQELITRQLTNPS
ncbi:RluA family pseudouridine synthase [Deferribacterales bacterium RsTz2092]|nr:pseudouridine synthase [Deferribacterales bacterium]